VTRQCVIASVLLALASSTRAETPAGGKPAVRLPITLHVAQSGGAPVVDETFIAERIARANEIFAVHGVEFAVKDRKPLAERHAMIDSRGDRDALGDYFARGTIHVFCVQSLRDVDEPDRVRRGVHWHSTTHAGAHYVILSSIAGVDVLAHELGHYLGNPEHSHVPGNLMSYERTDAMPFLDELQAARLRRRLRSYLSSHELVPLPAVAAR
jgi:hypothetical protein